jgi:type II secretory pathway pseudopilin PulG
MRHLDQTRRVSFRPRWAAFTLVELLGGLVILSLLLGAAAQTTLGRMKQANRDSEAAELTQQIKALERSVARNLAVPGVSNWMTVIAEELVVPSSAVAANRQGLSRALLVDPNCRIGPQTNGFVPYFQSSVGSLEPAQVRFILLSSVASALPDLTHISFEALWDAPAGTFPTGWPGDWPGTAEDLLRVRLDLGSRFKRVLLNNHDLVTASHSVGTATPAALASFQTGELWLLTGSVLNLRYADGTLQGSEFVFEDVSFSFQGGQWTRGLRRGREAATEDSSLIVLAEEFLDTSLPPPPLRTPGSPQAIMHSFHLFMSTYALWAEAGFSSSADINWAGIMSELQAGLQTMTTISR